MSDTTRYYTFSANGVDPVRNAGNFDVREDAVATAVARQQSAFEEFGVLIEYTILYRDVTTESTAWKSVDE